MAKRTQHTKVIVNGADVSSFVERVDVARKPGEVETATITFVGIKFNIESDGTFVVDLDTKEPQWLSGI